MPTIASIALALGVLAGCGGSDEGGSDETGAQVSPGPAAFVVADLDDVPVPPLAEPLSPVRELDDGVLVRSWEVRDRTTEQVITFYEELFVDLPAVEPVENAPGQGDVLRASWQLEDGLLHVTAQAAPAVDAEDGSEGHVTQLSLELHPSGG